MSKYSNGYSEATRITEDLDCACSICGEDLLAGDLVVDQEIYKCGELDSIECSHARCAPLQHSEDLARD